MNRHKWEDPQSLERSLGEVIQRRRRTPIDMSSTRQWRLEVVEELLSQDARTEEEELILVVHQGLLTIERHSLPAARALELKYFAHLDTQTIARKTGKLLDSVRAELTFARAMMRGMFRVR